VALSLNFYLIELEEATYYYLINSFLLIQIISIMAKIKEASKIMLDLD